MDAGNTPNRPDHRTPTAGRSATTTPAMSPDPQVDTSSDRRSTRSLLQEVLTLLDNPERIRREPTVEAHLREGLTRTTSRPGNLQGETTQTEGIRENLPTGLADLFWPRLRELCSTHMDSIMDVRLSTAIADHTDYLIARIVPKVSESDLFIDSLLQAVQGAVTRQASNLVPRTTPQQINHLVSIWKPPTEPPGAAEYSAPRREYHQANLMVGQSRSRIEASRLDERQVAHQENPREGQARSRREAPRLEERSLAPPDGFYEVQRP
ncbi:unnamed protein product [Agarophyton chilense]